MPHESPELETTFGYLSAVHTAEHGYFGGYLIITAAGRPLEFHCTAPVLPSRAQEILYGPTLQHYLIGDQIGGTLLRAAKLTPHVILTNHGAVAALRPRAPVPIVLVMPGDDSRSFPPDLLAVDRDISGASNSTAMADDNYSAWSLPFTIGKDRLKLPLDYAAEQETVVALLKVLSERVDLAEPFERIHEAICEAQRLGGREDDHGQAA
jgi:hypothetical protein